jgi:hypothetical protein
MKHPNLRLNLSTIVESNICLLDERCTPIKNTSAGEKSNCAQAHAVGSHDQLVECPLAGDVMRTHLLTHNTEQLPMNTRVPSDKHDQSTPSPATSSIQFKVPSTKDCTLHDMQMYFQDVRLRPEMYYMQVGTN